MYTFDSAPGLTCCGDSRQAKALWNTTPKAQQREPSPTSISTQKRQSKDTFHQPRPRPCSHPCPRIQKTRAYSEVNDAKASNTRARPAPAHNTIGSPGLHRNTASNKHLFQQRRVARHRLLEGRRISRPIFPRHGPQKSGAIGDRRSDGANAVCRGRVSDQTFSAEPEEQRAGTGEEGAWAGRILP